MDTSSIPQTIQLDPEIDPVEESSKKNSPDEGLPILEEPNGLTENIDDDSVSIQTGTDDLLPLDSDAVIPPQEHKLGLDINAIRGWSGSEYDDYDVIAVHGIRDDYKTAWIDKKGGWILKEHLFKGMSIREIDYSYEIHDKSVLYRHNGIDILARELVGKYAEERQLLAETETDRPIIWTCHDIGGTIVKQVFIGTPHRFESIDDACDQIYKLVYLPGPDIKNGTLSRVKHLAEQTERTNARFVTTKLLDRACIFNILSQNVTDSLAKKADDEVVEGADGFNYNAKDWSQTVAPFRRNAHFIGHSFEAGGRLRNNNINHLDLIRDEGCTILDSVSKTINKVGFSLKICYGMIALQTRLLSLAPPTRVLSIPFDPVLPYPPVLRWLHQQAPYVSFNSQKSGPNYLHIHGDGSPLVDIIDVSRRLYAHLDADLAIENPTKTVIYFEFDQHDSRYRNLTSMLAYLLNALLWHFWPAVEGLASEELAFLRDTNSWTVEDLYHMFINVHHRLLWKQDLTFFISCFDQCPENQRQWFIDRLLQNQSYSEASFRIVISTSSSEGLGIDKATSYKQVNLFDCPLFKEPQTNLSSQLGPELDDLITTRPVYAPLLSQITDLVNECQEIPQLAPLIIQWLASRHRDKNDDEINSVIASLSPMTASNITMVFMEHLPRVLRQRAETAFNWIQHAVEPWSADALIEALALQASPNKESCLFDLDKQVEIMQLIKALGGIITLENDDIKFCHPSFYQVTGLIGDQSPEDFAAGVHYSMATTCLRYFQLHSAQMFLDDVSLAALTDTSSEEPLEPFIIYHQRASMAEYAVRFWADHYKASGLSKPKKLVRDLLGNRRFRSRWEITFWLMSNPFTRIGRHYLSILPLFAMLGLQDLVDDEVISGCDQPWFGKDCWYAITEAIRSGNTKIAKRLLGQVEVDEGELQVALLFAAAKNDLEIIQCLLDKIPNLRHFEWPENLIFRAAALGQDGLLSAMLTSGCDVDEVGTYWAATAAIDAAWRNQVSTLEMMFMLEERPDPFITDDADDNLVMVAIRMGNPDVIRVITCAIWGPGKIDSDKLIGEEVMLAALCSSGHKALALLLEIGLAHGERYGREEPFLVTAANGGLTECVRVLLSYKLDVDLEGSNGTALYRAVSNGYIDIVRLLLDHEPKPKMDITPPGSDTILVIAICSGNVDLVSLLIDHGAVINYVDENDDYNKTPLSRACVDGNLEMVKILLENKADVNYTGDGDAPLYVALFNDNINVARYLLENSKPDVTWKGSEGIQLLHGACDNPEILPELLKLGCPIDGVSIWGTILHMAASEGLLQTIQVLLKNDPKPDLDIQIPDDIDAEDDIGYTPLQLACQQCSFDCVKELLEAGANPHIINEDGEDLIDILLRASPGSEDCRKCSKLLFSAPYSLPKELADEAGQTRLHRIRQSTPIEFVQSLTSIISDLDVLDRKGYTPLAVSVSQGNINVARYLIELGAKVNIFSPEYGSILHIAVSNGAMDLTKILIDSGADPEIVDPQYGESLMYTALGISTSGSRHGMVRYLADEAKVSIGKLGGALGYPVIRAAFMTIQPNEDGVNLLKFFDRRNARLGVTDNQGRSVVHFVSRSNYHDMFKSLLRDNNSINAVDKFGRMPIHFAASNSDPAYLDYLLGTGDVVDIDARDLDQWTPLMWAARSGSMSNIQRLLSEKADIWARSISSDSRDIWSPLKLARFAGQSFDMGKLEPQERTRVDEDGTNEVWNEYFHKIKEGDSKGVICDSCLVDIIGLQWKCMECKENFNLCFKCFPNRSGFHDLGHNFESIGPLYYEEADNDSVTTHGTNEGVLSNHELELIPEEDNESGADELDSDSDS
ncbi:hypothetical protein FSST1_002851 [Fusarium sambucinum]